MASTLSQIGILETRRNDPLAGIPWNLKALMIRLEIQVPQVQIDIHQLQTQRSQVGDERFLGVLTESLGEDGAQQVIELLDRLKPGQE